MFSNQQHRQHAIQSTLQYRLQTVPVFSHCT